MIEESLPPSDDDTYQIVLGPGVVARVTPEFEKLVGSGAGELKDSHRGEGKG